MAGFGEGFNGEEFRKEIRAVYTMAAVPNEAEQAIFLFASQLVYAGPVDEQNLPFDPQTTVQRVTPAPVKVPCGIDYFDDRGELTNFGIVTPSRVAITLLDEDYGQAICRRQGWHHRFPWRLSLIHI